MRGLYGKPLLGYAPVAVPGAHRAIDDDYTTYGHVRPVSEMSSGDLAAVGIFVAIGIGVVWGGKRASDYVKDRHDEKIKNEGRLPKARVLNGVRR